MISNQRISPKHIICLVLILIVLGWFAYLIFGFSSTSAKYGIFGDEGIFLSGAQRILRGELPHKDFYTLLPTASYYPLALFFRLFGDNYIVAQVFVFLNAVGIGGAMFWLGWRLLRWWSSVPAIIFLLFVFPAWPYASHHWTFLLFALLSTCCCLQKNTGWHVTAGVFSGLSFLLFPQKALFTFFAHILVFLLFRPRGFRSAVFTICWYLAGLLPVILIHSWWLLHTGAWTLYIQQVFVDSFKYYPDFVMQEIFFRFNNVAALLTLGIVGFALMFFFRRHYTPLVLKTYIAIFLVHVSLLISILYHLELYHVLQVIPAAIVLIFFIIVFFAQRIRDVLHAYSSMALAAFIIFAVIISVSVPFTLAYESSYGFGTGFTKNVTAFSTPRGKIVLNHRQTPYFIEEYKTVSSLVDTQLLGKSIFFFPYAPGYYYFLNLRNTTSFDFIGAEMIAHAYREQIAQELAHVDVIILLPTSWGFDPQGAFMKLIPENFSFRQELLEGRVTVLSRDSL
ncbi:MAG: hypothetical protein V1685_04345 [Parcubacteria group bacterium]